MTDKPRVRCAIYTRKSSEEGLDQAFNSLHAQREACEAYIKSQAHEGWRLVPKAFDDGGISGGTLERPGLQRLLIEVERGLVDTIVVYKIDRLTRSLADFARIVERLEAKGASFVSVTQAFNTTTSMGRLTLNVLLSFAQFEREVTGERIRDKIAASKKKGMWMGGAVPLGYDAPTDPVSRALVVNGPEAETVRFMFRRYLELGSVSALAADLSERQIVSKARTTKSGRRIGGVKYGRGALYHLLQNRTYLGEVPHKDQSYAGVHPAILEEELFAAVQSKIASQRRRQDKGAGKDSAPLKGILFDAAGVRMSPAFSYGQGGRRYRYYVSSDLQRGRRLKPDPAIVRRISAAALEAQLAAGLGRAITANDPEPDLRRLLGPVQRLRLTADGVIAVVKVSGLARSARSNFQVCIDNPDFGEVFLPMKFKVRGGRTRIMNPPDGPALIRRDPVLIGGLRQAHTIVRKMGWNMGDGPDVDAVQPASPYERRLCRLAFLAPKLQKAILEGRQSPETTLESLLNGAIPLVWATQIDQFGSKTAD